MSATADPYAVIGAVETRYNGYRFRSRLEARWAIFFESVGLRYEYEPQAFDLSKIAEIAKGNEAWRSEGWYLPDFYLSELRTWIEIKPSLPNHKDRWNLEYWPDTTDIDGLGILTGKKCVKIFGTPGRVADVWGDDPPYEGFITGDSCYFWCACLDCGAVGIQYEGRSERNQHAAWCKYNSSMDCRVYAHDHPLIEMAMEHARSYRFDKR